MADALLVLNAGSSSVKFSLYAIDAAILVRDVHGQIEGLNEAARFVAREDDGNIVAQHDWSAHALDHAGATAFLLRYIERDLGRHRVVAAGHRVVHGGVRFTRPVVVDENILRELEALIPLAQTFGLPFSLTESGVRRYGFHGLSYEFIVQRLLSTDATAARGRVIIAHLGNGASMCAIDAGKSVATTMGFTALDGLVMGTRTGTLDPGVVLYLQDELKMDAGAVEDLLYRKSGLLGVSGVSPDMRTLLASAAPRAQFAIELFCYRAVREVGSLVAALRGLDALVFTAGIGEHAAPIRARIVNALPWLGFELDEAANADDKQRITKATSRIPAYVIPTDEELMIARHTRDAMGAMA